MALDVSKATKKTPVTAAPAFSLEGDANPFKGTTGANGTPVVAKPANDYSSLSFAKVPGKFDALREQIAAANPGVPRSFIDAEVDKLNSGVGLDGHSAAPNLDPNDPQTQQYLATQVGLFWNADKSKDQYIQTDSTAQQTKDVNNTIAGTSRAIGTITNNQTQSDNAFNNQYVIPAVKGAQAAVAGQPASDRADEAQLSDIAHGYATDLDQYEALRMAGIGSTNSQLTDLANQYRGASDSTNASNSQFASQFIPIANQANSLNSGLVSNLFDATNSTNAANSQLGSNLLNYANSTNANQTGLYNTLAGQASSINANQTGLYNQLAGQASSINANQTDLFNQLAGQATQINAAQTNANNEFQGQLSGLNSQQDAANALLQGQLSDLSYAQNDSDLQLRNSLNALSSQAVNAQANYESQLGDLSSQQTAANSAFQGQLSGLNEDDRASLARYMSETDPLMTAQVAQGTDPADRANMLDVVQRYKDLSSPMVSAQERLVAEQARRKFESDDQSNREALMQQLRGRGLQSGGLVVAGLQAANQQTSNDRQMAELGLNAQAQQRAMQGLAGYADTSTALRNADDAMRNFQDQYAQNDAIRRGNLAGQRQSANQATTNAITDRDTAGFNANTTTVNNNTQRAALGYESGRNVINDNTNRAGMIFDADTATYNADTNRAGMGFDAATTSLNANTNRDALGFQANTTTNNNNWARDQGVFDAGTTTNNNNYARDESVFNAGTTTNNNNYARDQSVFNAGTTTNEDNYNRYSNATTTNVGINQANLGNTQFATTTGIGVNNDNATRSRNALQDNINTNQTNLTNTAGAIGVQMGTVSGNDTRTQAGLDKGEVAAGNKANALQVPITTHTQNVNTETNNATQLPGTLASTGATLSTISGGDSAAEKKAQQDALDAYLLGKGITEAKKTT